MISDQEFLEIIQGLYEKTANENLNWWAKTPPEDAFWIQLPPGSVIELQYGRPKAEPDFITFLLMRYQGGPVLASRKVYEGDLGWDQLNNLYALIKRRELGWDDLLKNMREFLNKKPLPTLSK